MAIAVKGRDQQILMIALNNLCILFFLDSRYLPLYFCIRIWCGEYSLPVVFRHYQSRRGFSNILIVLTSPFMLLTSILASSPPTQVVCNTKSNLYFYVGNLTSGCNSEDKVIDYKQAWGMMNEARFNSHSWTSSNSSLCSKTRLMMPIKVIVLDLWWDTLKDILSFTPKKLHQLLEKILHDLTQI